MCNILCCARFRCTAQYLFHLVITHHIGNTHRMRNLCVDAARSNGIATDPIQHVHIGSILGQRNNCRFRSTINCTCTSPHTSNRCYIDYATLCPLAFKCIDCFPHRCHGSVDIHFHDLLVFLIGYIANRAHVIHSSRIINQNIQLSKMLYCTRNHLFINFPG